jgi:ABC-type dipeptide/oligopeptide/nickel transport system ATPase subunit
MIAHAAHRASGVARAPRLELTGVSKAFGGVPKVIDMSLAVSPGEIHALVGENGAGKSTVMNMVSGVLAPDSGEIRLDGGGTDGDSGKGAAIAVRDAGRVGKVKIVAMDRNDDMSPFIEDGTIHGSVVQKSYAEAFIATHFLYWLNANEMKGAARLEGGRRGSVTGKDRNRHHAYDAAERKTVQAQLKK